MNPNSFDCQWSESKYISRIYSLFVTAALICGAYFTGSAFIAKDYGVFSGIRLNSTQLNALSQNCQVLPTSNTKVDNTGANGQSTKCEEKCPAEGSDALPEGIAVTTSNLDMVPLWGPLTENKPKNSTSLLALPVGIKQKELVNQMVGKFLESGFVVMLFHYDNVMDEWSDLEWSSNVIHVSVSNQTKWWFAKRFLHPDIVADYDFIFLWDEDLGVENFDPARYVSIIREEGLEISQPALDPAKSEVHHPITALQRRGRVHRQYFKNRGGKKCDGNSTAPPCTGWVEMMAPVFSRAAWRCVWYMIQNDLIHAWGLDYLLGYCAQGDRTLKVGVVDAEYIIHVGIPTLGGLPDEPKEMEDSADKSQTTNNSSDSRLSAPPPTPGQDKVDIRYEVRKRSYEEMQAFRRRWSNAVKEDSCWIDPYQQTKQK